MDFEVQKVNYGNLKVMDFGVRNVNCNGLQKYKWEALWDPKSKLQGLKSLKIKLQGLRGPKMNAEI